MIENGTDPEVLNQVYTPIGLNIGAETPEEIGVAIMAEIIQVKNQKLRSCGFPTEVSRFLNNHSPERLPAILTTIVARHGSAPRSVGTQNVSPSGRNHYRHHWRRLYGSSGCAPRVGNDP